MVILLDSALLMTSDLPAQAYARQLAELLPSPDATALIGAMRRLLEQGLHPDGLDLTGCGTGVQAVDRLGAAAGVDEQARAAAAALARADVQRSLFLLDPPERLRTFLRCSAPATVLVSTDWPDETGAVIEALELNDVVDHLVAPDALPIGPEVIAVGCSWDQTLRPVAAGGGRTGLVDRFDAVAGHPTWRAADLTTLLDLMEAAL